MASDHVGELPDPKDPWTLANGPDYSIDTFYTRSTDGRGNYEQMRFKMSGQLHSAITRMIKDEKFPSLNSVADVMRDALIHRLVYINKNYDQLAAAVNAEIVLATVQMDVAKNQMRDEVIHQHEDQLAVLEKAEDWHAIIRAVDTMSSVVDEWSDTRHGRDLQRVIETYVERARRRLRIVAGE
jgi:hypothetical protein